MRVRNANLILIAVDGYFCGYSTIYISRAGIGQSWGMDLHIRVCQAPLGQFQKQEVSVGGHVH